MTVGVLVYFHCPSNTGYAIERLEKVFYRMAQRLAGSDSAIFFAYVNLDAGMPKALPQAIGGVFQIDAGTKDPRQLAQVRELVQKNRIRVVLGFDQQPGLPVYRALRQGGVHTIASYWGAPMSSLNSGLKLLFKKLQVRLLPGPDLYIFESEAMRLTAIQGRGLSATKTAVVYLGVDTEQFAPAVTKSTYAHGVFGIPENAHIVFYSGHMEPRKGVAVIVRAARRIAEAGRDNVYFLLLGNKAGEEAQYDHLYKQSGAEKFVVFGGYRSDIAELMRCASVGVIASTGWDSFTRSAVELAASGVPLIVSRLQGLVETVDEGVTGFTFAAGDDAELARLITGLLDDPQKRTQFAEAARSRTVARFTERRQIDEMVAAISNAKRTR
jgi:glycosyltransferase involved in cell wall biosynthesis